MKHFGAQLTGQNNQVDGGSDSILTIGANDSLFINASRPSTDANLGATPSTAQIAATQGLIIATANGATHILGADGREVLISDVGGGVNTQGILPISSGSAFVDSIFSQSVVGGGATQAKVGGNFTVEGNLTVTGATITANVGTLTTEDKYIAVNQSSTTTLTSQAEAVGAGSGATSIEVRGVSQLSAAQINASILDPDYTATLQGDDGIIGSDITASAYDNATGILTLTLALAQNWADGQGLSILYFDPSADTTADGGLLVLKQTATNLWDASTGSFGSTSGGAYAGIRFRENADGSGSWEVTEGVAANGSDDANWAELTTATSGVNSVGAGDGISITGTGTAPVVNVNDDDSTLIADGTSLRVKGGGIGAAELNGGDDTTKAVLGNGDNGQFLASKGSDGGFEWVTGATGTVDKHSFSYQVASGEIQITASGGTGPHGLSGSDFTISVFEHLNNTGAQITAVAPDGAGNVTGSVRLSQIFPESISVGTDSAGSGEDQEGTITIKFPTSENSNPYRVVIKS